MNKLVAASASWLDNTLFSRHSTLNEGFRPHLYDRFCDFDDRKVVQRCLQMDDAGAVMVWVSIFCATAGQIPRPALRTSTQRVSWMFFPFVASNVVVQETPSEVSWTAVVSWFKQRRNISRWELRPPLSIGKDHLPVAYFAASRLDRELPDSLQNHGEPFSSRSVNTSPVFVTAP